MNLLTIALVALGLLAIAGILVANIDTASADESKQIECSRCGGSCSQSQNCGLKSCSAVSGGKCGCGK
ncbi:hypothetical protein GF378_00495 [Candidatus Pacearchaeota archaeon]|nr:hypothetical protein [Candidatus Pacearchaeota archaeon]